jgi:multiple sugar transport system ATP-binding protein
MASITYDHIWKKFGDVVAVQDLDIQIEDKEFLVFVGPSGCGKSTSLRMLAGLEEISEGTIRIGDRIVNDVPPKDRNIAMVFQSYALYPHMSVYDNMAFGLKLRKTPKADIDRRVKEAAGLLGIENLLDRKPKQLSGGQRQRVALGPSFASRPCSSWTSPFRTWMPSSVFRRVPRSPSCTCAWKPPSSTSPTTRPRP